MQIVSEKKKKSDELENNSGPKEDKKVSEEEKLKTELKNCKDLLLRTAAEYENFRKRSEKEKESIYQDAISLAILAILPVADSLDAAMSSMQGQSEESKKGIELISSQLTKALGVLDVSSFGDVGDKFDPSIHSAISHIEDDSEKENEISKVFQKGYKSKTRIIRHAMVQVIN
jgi:molecular chaperone GrpE